jgi:hypothetical protein
MAATAVYYPVVAVGDLVTADLLQSMVPKYYVKPTGESRTSTTTLADDSDLQAIPLAVGTYEIEFLGFMTQTTTTTQKLKGRWGFTGTWNNGARNVIGPGQAQTAAPANVTETNFAGAQASGQDVIVSTAAGGTFCSWREWSVDIVVTVAGNLSYQWAQSASSANATRLEGESSFRVRRIG